MPILAAFSRANFSSKASYGTAPGAGVPGGQKPLSDFTAIEPPRKKKMDDMKKKRKRGKYGGGVKKKKSKTTGISKSSLKSVGDYLAKRG